MIRVHLIRHCYPLPSAISDMGIKCWTSFWVILGAQRATTYTPLSQWGLGFVVKPWEQRESVFPEQRPCPRLRLGIHLTAHFLEWKIRREGQDKSWPAHCVAVLRVFSFKIQHGLKIEHSKVTAAGRTEHLNPIVNLKKNCPTCWCCCVFMIYLFPPLIPMLLPQWMTKKSPF